MIPSATCKTASHAATAAGLASAVCRAASARWTKSPRSSTPSHRWIQWTALSQLSATPTANSQGIRLGNFVQVREAIEGELENIFAGKKSVKEGLDAAVAKSNEILKEFAAANKP